MRLLVIGAPGSGKTTQAKILAEWSGLCLVKIGSMLREYVEKEHHPEVLCLMERGKLVDNQLTAGLVRERIEGEECKLGFVSDGYPRSLDQLKAYDPGIERVIYLITPKEEVEKRLAKRGRLDDDRQTIRQRLEVFDNLTVPLIEDYDRLDKVIKIDGSGSIAQVAEKIREALESQ